MMDVGEGGRPPGDPPDRGSSWVSKVVDTAEEGMPVPEVLITDSFVSERVRVEFPNGEDGEPSVTIENEVLEAMNGMWKKCMIVRILGRNVPIVALTRKLRELWNPKGNMYVMDLPRQFFMVWFEKEDEYLVALTGGPWRAFGSYLMVRVWSPDFAPLRDDIVTTPVPEVLIADSFVSERVRVEFPNGEDGEPSVTIENEVLEAMNGMWKKCMIVRVLGRNVPIVALTRKLRELWNPKGNMYVMDLPRQFFIVRFEKEDEYLVALTGGPWRAFGSYLMVRAWSPDFDPPRDDIVTTPVWIRLMNIQVNFYHRSILMGIAKELGKLIRVDSTTLQFERARFARVYVEVNLAKPLKGTVLINGERYFVAYERLSEIGPRCGLYGHLIHGCPRTLAEREESPKMQTEVEKPVETVNLQNSQMQ
ncbi:hypothetical protein Bca4012_062542 [Brassica carinata]